MRSFPSERNSKHRKIIYLTTFLITCFHEILGNLFLTIYNYLNKNNQINSLIKNNVEELLFGNYKSNMTLNQMLFTLEIKNYSVDYKEFKHNFETKSNNTILESISNELKYILNLYEIEFDMFDLQIEESYIVSQYNKEAYMYLKFPSRHSLRKLLMKKLNESNDESSK